MHARNSDGCSFRGVGARRAPQANDLREERAAFVKEIEADLASREVGRIEAALEKMGEDQQWEDLRLRARHTQEPRRARPARSPNQK